MLMIADNLWNEISAFITFKKSRVGRPMHDSKLVLSGIFYIMQTDAQWRKKLGHPEAFITDTTSSKAPFANFGGKNPIDRAKNGVKRRIIIDWNRIILSVKALWSQVCPWLHKNKLLLA